MLDFNKFHPRQKKGVVLRRLQDEAILYDPETKKVHVLNVTSMFIWNLCTGDHNLEAIEKEVKSQFKVDEDCNVRTDTEETVMRFRTEGLLIPED
jgi:hypothetical protein